MCPVCSRKSIIINNPRGLPDWLRLICMHPGWIVAAVTENRWRGIDCLRLDRASLQSSVGRSGCNGPCRISSRYRGYLASYRWHGIKLADARFEERGRVKR